MLRNHFITAIRYLYRNKLQSVIQIGSLTVGMLVMMLIGLYMDHELSHDKFNEKYDRIYRLEYGNSAGLPTAIGHQIKGEITNVEDVVRIVSYRRENKALNQIVLKYTTDRGRGFEKIKEVKTSYIYCDSTMFDVFTLPFIQGLPKIALRDPYSVVLTESTARSIFGNKDPMGELVDIETAAGAKYTVTGVIQDVEQFHLDFEMLLSMESLRVWDSAVSQFGETNWLNAYYSGNHYLTFLLLQPHQDPAGIENILNAYFKEKIKNHSWFYSEQSDFSLRPLREIYFSSPIENEFEYSEHGNLKLIRILLLIAVFILVLAIINYVNLTTARASVRTREVGIRKMAGSSRSTLVFQFLMESIIQSLVSFLLALTLVQMLLPVFNQISLVEISLARLFQSETILLFITGILSLGCIAGLYPSVYLAVYKPVSALANKQAGGLRSMVFRRILLTFQFTISIVLIIGVFTIFSQLKYMRNADLGFGEELVVNIPVYGMHKNVTKRKLFRERLLQNPGIRKVAFGSPPGRMELTFPYNIEYNGIKVRPKYLRIDPDYFDLFDIPILQGRNFSWDRSTDSSLLRPRVIINETAQRAFGIESAVGKWFTNENGERVQIIGVVKDFHFASLHHRIEPYIYYWFGNLLGVNIKIAAGNIQGTLEFIKKEVESMYSGATFKYSFLDKTLNRQYNNDDRLARLIGNFALIAIIIGCLGLFGLSFFMAARRTKEIGIRKSLGASNRTIFILLSKEFIKWVALSVVIACPIAWIIMDEWLQSFAYRTKPSIWIFLLAGMIAFAISFLTVAWHAWKTARTNPIEALRYE